ncbi:hypothetical protein FD06_GL000602 [Apilactobacillus ozensis DSM 23829 = JCM 17196]|uniref:Extracellular protein n=1 Tax=Apilactobacillus ozensis DSM 23829 = JCM 17196 TaxID=1423781 RepID=A0A0R2AMF8_9LACO|nr:YpmS family protein [Apilactobacillus ozensis]KRM67882.1 hypothetical protein FD06_GL000602 [Apilactobacillus ozensis DSM 23829 = JCM 17196]
MRKKRFNIFKYLFILLILAIIIGAGFVWFSVNSTPVSESKTAVSQKYNHDATPITVGLNKKQLNALSTYYLEKVQSSSNDKMDYKFVVTDRAYVYGNIKLLGSKIKYVLALKPKLLSDGNIQLDADGLEIGKLNIPPKFVLSYVSRNYKIPSWVKLDSKNSKIILNVNDFGSKDNLSYRATKIDMNGDGDFKFQVLIPK